MPKPYSTDLRERAVEAVEAILLPLPRVDRVNEVETLGRAWRNCLGAYGSAIDAGRCAVYLWEAEKPAVCLVGRHGRLGWFLDEVKGPQNIEIEAEQRVLQVVSHNSCCFAPSREAVPLSSDQGPSPLSASARVWYPSLPQAWSRMS
jgi:hypothetical protein